MFCEQCGHPLGVDASFCSRCGARAVGTPTAKLAYATTQADRISDDEPIFVLRPQFIGWVTALSTLPIQLFMTVWAGGFCGGFSTLGIQGLKAIGLGGIIPGWFPFAFFACLAFFGIPGFTYFGKKRSYAKTEYRFYSNRLEYFEGFFTIEQKTVMYRNVLEVDLKKGIVQRQYGLGTIVLATSAQGTSKNIGKSGIQVSDIEGPDEVYEQVKNLIRRTQHS